MKWDLFSFMYYVKRLGKNLTGYEWESRKIKELVCHLVQTFFFFLIDEDVNEQNDTVLFIISKRIESSDRAMDRIKVK